ncbi:MAG: hypothetical protein OMM_03399 [Candidatus Magnetoglobus multicellularis str. Araruama]|uniref:TPR repeat-containing protein n=1 Tax=Candidatus Magnetoglobus multicellularis str. Araruama TaxID=890399 RepID=A0A1V1P651_9BACT|nr:MAG: hypothetical protein OMM_03399 [Candidatus Magnetoglobus multicellularis str. Araruama]
MSHIIVTETLARLYEEHGVLDKAKEVYSLLLEQNPDRDDFASKISDLDSRIQASDQQTPADYRKTLDQGFANDQEGMPLNAALDEFHEQKVQFDPALLDQIMVMTDYESLQQSAETDIQDLSDDTMANPGLMPGLSKTDSTSEMLPQMMNKWLDLLMMKRKLNQLQQLKQRVR